MPRTQKANTPVVALIMGSKSDLDVVKGALTVLDKFEVPYTARVMSAHRTPDAAAKFAEEAEATVAVSEDAAQTQTVNEEDNKE